MSDIFISYASEDRDRARDIAEALEEHGWSVWWDRHIPPGKAFDEVISEALDAARCVIVLWSAASTKSNWVKEEAAEGQQRNMLVPVLIEDVTIPLGFRRLQAARLEGWNKNSASPQFTQLLEAVADVLSADVARPTASEKQAQSSTVRAAPARTHASKQQERRGTMVRWAATLAVLVVFFFIGGFSLDFFRELGFVVTGSFRDIYG